MKRVQRIINNDMTAFDEIYNESKKSVYFAIYVVTKSKEVTEDLMQETYMEFLQKIKKLPPKVDVTAYLVTSAKNKAINFYNRYKRERDYILMLENYSYQKDKVYDTGLLEVIKNTLSEKEANVFFMKVLGEYSFKEISKILKIPIGTLTWTYQECRKKLQKVLKGGC